MYYTHQLYVVDLLLSELFQSLDGVSLHREGHARQSLLLSVHTDVCLYLDGRTHGHLVLF